MQQKIYAIVIFDTWVTQLASYSYVVKFSAGSYEPLCEWPPPSSSFYL